MALEKVNILGERAFCKNVKIKTMDYFSGHADQNELIDYLRLNPTKNLKIYSLSTERKNKHYRLRRKNPSKGYKNVDFPLSEENL